jgi:regulator of protease activity HflC (stomatin/prohibitin superfamily)
LPKFSFNNFSDRQAAASEARKALLDKFKNRPAEDDPVVQARKAERAAILQARGEREAAKAKIRAEEEAIKAAARAEREAIEAAERAAREAQEAAARAAREAARSNLVSRAILEQMDWKAQRLAARKKR